LASACPGWIEPHEPEDYDHSTAGGASWRLAARPQLILSRAQCTGKQNKKLKQKNHLHSYLYKTGLGATVGLLLGIVGNFSIGVMMIILFVTNIILRSTN
jgi:hypothetical protein